MTTNRVVPVGVVLCVDGDYYVATFRTMEPVTLPLGTAIELTLDPLRISPWSGPTSIGLIPLKGMRDLPNPLRPDEPRPPKFATVEEAEEWLANHPVLLDTGDDHS